MHRSRTWRVVASLTALAALTAACGDDDDDAADTDETTTTAEPVAEGDTVEVTAVDYAFQGLPGELDAGTTLTLTNSSAAEVHEIVAFRLPDAETRSAGELLQLPEEELGAVFGGEPEPAFVLVAMPGEDGAVAVPAGGEATLEEPGRYLVACFIPTGADPQVYRDALESGAQEAPEIENPGPPHAAAGMFAEVQVS